METLKPLDELTQPDSRNRHYVVTERLTGKTRPLDVTDIHAAVSKIELDDAVPAAVRSQFDTARNLAVYSWYCSSFHQVSELKAFATVEYALRDVLNRKRLGLARLLKMAVERKLLLDRGFTHVADVQDEDTTTYCESLRQILPRLRNSLAHGSTALHPGSVTNLQICADLINQLYTARREAGASPAESG